ncbi:MAG: hypothetical protein AB1351_07825 [Thermoproteota archaeon]
MRHFSAPTMPEPGKVEELTSWHTNDDNTTNLYYHHHVPCPVKPTIVDWVLRHIITGGTPGKRTPLVRERSKKLSVAEPGKEVAFAWTM